MDKHEFRNIQKKLKLTNADTSKVLGVQIFTVRSWASGLWEVPLMAEKFLRHLLLTRIEDDYRPGYNAGYSKGYKAGLMRGFTDGYNAALGD